MARRSTFVLFLALLVALQAPLAPAAVSALPGPDSCAADGDAGDADSEADPLGAPAACTGSVSFLDPADRYVFSAARGQRVDLSFEADAGHDVRACILGPDDAHMGCRTARGAAASFAFAAAAGGAHTLVILRSGSPAANYRFELAVTEMPPQDDCGTGSDAGDTAPFAAAVTFPVGCEAAIGAGGIDREDWYSFEVVGGARLVATTSSDAALARTICLRAPGSSYSPCGSTGVTVVSPAAGVWLLQVRSSGTGDYGISVSIQDPPGQDDCATGGDVGGTPDTAHRIATPVACAGTLAREFGDAYDVYVLTAAVGERINATLASTDSKSLCVLDPSGFPVKDGCIGAGQTVAHLVHAPGDYFFRIYSWSGASPYTLSVDLTTPAAPWQSDCGASGDAGNHAAAARVLAGSACDAQLGHGWDDPEDWYAIEAVQGATTRVLLEFTGGDADVCVYRADARALIRCSTYPAGYDDAVSFAAEESGTHFVRVISFSGEPAYRLSVSSAFTQDDCASGRDTGLAEGALRAAGPVCHGSLPILENDLADAYLVHAEAGQTIAAALVNQPLFDYDLCIYAPGETAPRACTASRGWTVERLSYAADVAGDWRAAIHLRSGSGEYDLALSAA